MTSYEQALADMFGLFNVAWNAYSPAIVGYVPAIRWPGDKNLNLEKPFRS